MNRSEMVETIARATHEANRAWCIAHRDESQAPWESAPEWQRDSAIAGVIGVIEKGYGPAESHASWMARKLSDGWVWGPTKDAGQKTHPCLKPYEELPEEQRKKDAIFCGVVSVMAAAFGIWLTVKGD